MLPMKPGLPLPITRIIWAGLYDEDNGRIEG